MATHVAASASRSDVLSAYNLCDTNDILSVPGGSAAWSAPIEVTKAITINGNGAVLTGSGVLTYGFFYLRDFTSDELMRVTGFTADLNDCSGGSAIGFSGLDLTKLRIDHNTFHHGTTVLEIAGCKGVVDNNGFYNGNCSVRFTAGTRTQADASWVSMAAGTGDALFVEDNDFILDAGYELNWNDAVFDTYNGGKLVIRHNTFDTNNLPDAFNGQVYLIQTHGNAAAGQPYGYWQASSTTRRGQSVVEIYNNTASGKRLHRLATIRGSANLIHDNDITTLRVDYRPCIIYMFEEEQNEPQFDPMRTAWPAEDQVHNTFIWDNSFDGVGQVDTDNIISADEAWIQKNRDYFTHRPATTGEGMTLGKEVFTGSNGGTNTYPTNGVVHPTYGSMAFVADVENAYYGYVPYTHPHPLVSQEITWKLSARMRF